MVQVEVRGHRPWGQVVRKELNSEDTSTSGILRQGYVPTKLLNGNQFVHIIHNGGFT